MKSVSQAQMKKISRRFKKLYGEEHVDTLERRFFQLIGRYGVGLDVQPINKRWDRHDVVLITYADMVQRDGEAPLKSLNDFATEQLKGAINTVHILPFYPWSSDDGFSVIDYRAVDPSVGDWHDVENLGKNFDLMFDLVLNHCSAKSQWFHDFVIGIAPECNYFIEADPKADLSAVVRPRTTPLLTPTRTRLGETHVWTTFSADQVDLNWKHPDLFFEFLDILMKYISHGARIMRLDAVAFLWKKIGTDCLHLPETHEVVKLYRDILEMLAPHVIILTETNVPHEENISYFGKGDEAHMVYNFSLPPLTLHALLTGDGSYLTRWARELAMPPKNCSFFNFTASHDGIGVRPAQGILPEKELNKLVKTVKSRGGQVSYKTNSDGSKSPYELNCTYFDALAIEGNDNLSIKRFLCSQAIALAFKGIPGIYFHSLTATPNDQEGFKETGRARTLNRRKWRRDELDAMLAKKELPQTQVFDTYIKMLRRRANHPAFSPEAKQSINDLGKELFVITRTAVDDSETIFCIFNLTDKEQVIINPQSTDLLKNTKNFYDILSARTFSSGKKGLTLQPYQALWLTPRA